MNTWQISTNFLWKSETKEDMAQNIAKSRKLKQITSWKKNKKKKKRLSILINLYRLSKLQGQSELETKLGQKSSEADSKYIHVDVYV